MAAVVLRLCIVRRAVVAGIVGRTVVGVEATCFSVSHFELGRHVYGGYRDGSGVFRLIEDSGIGSAPSARRRSSASLACISCLRSERKLGAAGEHADDSEEVAGGDDGCA